MEAGGVAGETGRSVQVLRKLPPPPPPRVLTPVAQATTAFPPLTAADRAARILWSRLAGCAAFTFHFHALEKEMATHSGVLAWRIPGTGEPGGLPSMGSHRVGHD